PLLSLAARIRRFCPPPLFLSSFLSTAPAPPPIYPLSLHDALPIYTDLPQHRDHLVGRRIHRPTQRRDRVVDVQPVQRRVRLLQRSEEHTSELQSRFDLVCRLLLEKKKKKIYLYMTTSKYITHFITS